MLILKRIWFGVLPTLLKMIDHANNTMGMEIFFQVSVASYELQKDFGASFSFKLKQNQMKLKKVEFLHP
jgi:hypothetical protein